MIEDMPPLVTSYATRVRARTSLRHVEVLDAIRSSDVRPVPWSGREAAREDPAA